MNLLAGKVGTEQEEYYWHDFQNMLDGKLTDVANWPVGKICFKVKSKANLIGMKFIANKDWNIQSDGYAAFECNELELSITPF